MGRRDEMVGKEQSNTVTNWAAQLYAYVRAMAQQIILSPMVEFEGDLEMSSYHPRSDQA